MGQLLSHSIVGGLVLIGLYLAYRLFLARNNQHSFNRGVLLAVYAVSFAVAPFIPYSIDLSENETPAIASSDFAEIVPVRMTETGGSLLWAKILVWIFAVGMVAVAIRTVAVWLRLLHTVRSGEKIRRSGYTLIVTDNDRLAPFSWMHYVVVNRRDYNDDFLPIATHELKHIASRHWIDLLIAQAACMVNWFNPAVWLMRDELMLIHEYQADMAVIDNGHDARAYQMLLIRKAVGSRFPSLANSLNHSKLKKRITMMYKSKSSGRQRLKAFALVPVVALSLGVAGIPAVRAAVTTIGATTFSDGKDNENLPWEDTKPVKIFSVISIESDGNRTVVVITGKGVGSSMTVSGGEFVNDGHVYQATSLQCDLKDHVATITAWFPFADKVKDASMSLTINGEEIPFNLGNFKQVADRRGKELEITSTSVVGNVEIDGNNISAPVGTKIFLDGKEITNEELSATPEDRIASVDVYKNENTIRVTTKTPTIDLAKIPDEITFYIDGKAVGREALSGISADKIESISVDKEGKEIMITLKK